MKHDTRRSFFAYVQATLAGLVGSAIVKVQAAVSSIGPAGPPFRRVVTGLDPQGRSTVVADGPVPKTAQWHFTAKDLEQYPFEKGIAGNELWIFQHIPTDALSMIDPLLGKLPENDEPPKGGVIARIHRFEPGVVYPMHSTDTVDLDIIISGQMELALETGSTILKSGDVVVQKKTRHRWRVVGDEPCVFVAVMVDASGSA